MDEKKPRLSGAGSSAVSSVLSTCPNPTPHPHGIATGKTAFLAAQANFPSWEIPRQRGISINLRHVAEIPDTSGKAKFRAVVNFLTTPAPKAA
jgi:hypothetical protein